MGETYPCPKQVQERQPLFNVPPIMSTGPFNMIEFRKARKLLKQNKASGPDELPNEAWLLLSQEPASEQLFLELLNDVLSSMQVPQSWKLFEWSVF